MCPRLGVVRRRLSAAAGRRFVERQAACQLVERDRCLVESGLGCGLARQRLLHRGRDERLHLAVVGIERVEPRRKEQLDERGGRGIRELRKTLLRCKKRQEAFVHIERRAVRGLIDE
jgi:hypothetical protein